MPNEQRLDLDLSWLFYLVDDWCDMVGLLVDAGRDEFFTCNFVGSSIAIDLVWCDFNE